MARASSTLSDREPEQNIWVLDLSRHFLTRVTTDAALDIQPAWMPDDRWIVFASNREGGTQNLWRQAADGTGTPERLTHPPTNQASPSGTPDGKRLLFATPSDAGDSDLVEMTLDDTGQIRPLVRTRFSEGGGEVSPDGRWLAYASNRSGKAEDLRCAVPEPRCRSVTAVSTAGGSLPDGRRTETSSSFLVPDRAVMSVEGEEHRDGWSATAPTTVLEPGYWSSAGRRGSARRLARRQAIPRDRTANDCRRPTWSSCSTGTRS